MTKLYSFAKHCIAVVSHRKTMILWFKPRTHMHTWLPRNRVEKKTDTFLFAERKQHLSKNVQYIFYGYGKRLEPNQFAKKHWISSVFPKHHLCMNISYGDQNSLARQTAKNFTV